MEQKQSFFKTGTDDLKDRVRELKESGYRMVQMSCTADEGYEILYTFDRDYELVSLRVRLGPDGEAAPLENPSAESSTKPSAKPSEALSAKPSVLPQVLPSISDIYWSAFTYENEIHDLFGIRVSGMVLDFKGRFYRLKTKTPWAQAGGGKEGDGL